MVILLLLAALSTSSTSDELSLLVFSKTVEYRHEAIPEGIEALRELGARRGWRVDATEDAGRFTTEVLEGYDVVVFLMTTGDVLDPEQQEAFESFVGAGKGYVGIHAAADTEYDWPWYGELVGAYFVSHPEIQVATYDIEDRTHPATAGLPKQWRRVDEHYNFNRNPRPSVHVVMSLDESSYTVEADAMGDHPVAWYHEHEGGRAFYTALGHTKAAYSDPLFRRHLEGAVTWAGGSAAR